MVHILNINGAEKRVDVDDDTPLLWVLRDVLHLNGTKFGCGSGLCGACTVHVDGEAQFACQTAVGGVGSAKIVTIEGAGETPLGQTVQQAWVDTDVVQCGYCQPGQIMRAIALLKQNPHPSDEDIRDGMSTNICRCGCYPRIHKAVKAAAEAKA
ncbi:MAG TPA: (2Fe-2S)-binding protein [Sphingobium sp.]